MKTVLVVVGTRPEAIKLAPVILRMSDAPEDFSVKVCVTGQHRDMLSHVFDFFGIVADYDLAVMEPDQSLCGLSAAILTRIEPVIDEVSPDLIVVQGDTTSAFIGALAAFYRGVPVAHIEAGLRSGIAGQPFPEELNRVLVSRVATTHFTPTARATQNLKFEGVAAESIYEVGNTVVDALQETIRVLDERVPGVPQELADVDFSRKILMVTGHRRENLGVELENICRALLRIVAENPQIEVVYPVHLNPRVQEPVHRLLGNHHHIHLVTPLDYVSFVWLMSRSFLILTDSGGIQEEAPSLGVPVLVTRAVTERPEGIDAGVVALVGTREETVYSEVSRLLHEESAYSRMSSRANPYGDGRAAERIIDILRTY